MSKFKIEITFKVTDPDGRTYSTEYTFPLRYNIEGIIIQRHTTAVDFENQIKMFNKSALFSDARNMEKISCKVLNCLDSAIAPYIDIKKTGINIKK